ncbi:MAG: enoyl-CoA hydratase-related protein [Anaerolineales bacterium]|nr:enoyl-CoA hydratase-related protein [Anaerolineales bacterium]MDW8162575.1 enoyl-CoA hydratase-related protein [Anaerolineales bacterium]
MNGYQTILCEKQNKIGVVKLNRPQALNALNSTLLRELMDALAVLDEDTEVRAIVIAGSERAFAAGADIREMAEASALEMFFQDMIGQFDRIRQIHKPIIAAVSGWCLGGGCELALSCDMIVASETARFGQPEVTIGVMPGAGGTQRLIRAVGKAIAMEMILNNRLLTAQEALHHGLVNRVVPPEEVLPTALKLAEEIANRAPLAVRLAKEAILYAEESFLSQGLLYERRMFYFLFNSEDQKEGMRAFLEKRSPTWKGQ